MNGRDQILARFSGGGDAASLFLPDLSLWYDFHTKNGSLPTPWQGHSLPRIARTMGVPVWSVAETERTLSSAVAVTSVESDGQRTITSETPVGTLTARWILGPDGAMWQTEYPVKGAQDLDALLALAEARRYAIPADLQQRLSDVGDDGLLAIELPRRPLSDLLHEYLGWSDGLMLLWEASDPIAAIIGTLEAKLQAFVASLEGLPVAIAYSPDNLDGQFISPQLFQAQLATSYQRSARTLHAQGKRFVVHIGGPARRLLAPLAASGIDGLEGVCGPPQSDATLAEARDLVGPHCTLWGGIPQDLLLGTDDVSTFEEAVRSVAADARLQRRTIIGVADRVPVDADLGRLLAIPDLLKA